MEKQFIVGPFGHFGYRVVHFCKALVSSGIHLQPTEDMLLWTGGDHSGMLTVKNVYTALSKKLWPLQIVGWRKHLWSWDLPYKIKLFTWLVVENKLLTWENLQKRGWIGPSICPLCLLEEETGLHLFVHCSFAQNLWQLITANYSLNTNWCGNSISGCFDTWTKQEKYFVFLPSLVCWYIWLERNSCIFDSHFPSLLGTACRLSGFLENLSGRKPLVRKMPRLKKTPAFISDSIAWFDGAAQANGLISGAGGIIKQAGNIIYRWTLNCGPGTNTRAELLGVWASLALDQVLRNTWSYLTIFGLRQPVKDGAPGEAEIGISVHFWALLGFWVNVMGKGCRPVGLPMLRPTFVMYK
jgi:hypothetical protein